MTIPTKRPTTTANDKPTQFSIPSIYNIANVAPTISSEERFVPRDNAPIRLLMSAFSFVRTENIPIIESTIPMAAMSIGAKTALVCMAEPCEAKAAAPSAADERIEPQ